MNSRDAAETYRSLHATIKFAAGETPVRSVLIVDVDRLKTSAVAENVAVAFARSGDRCAFVEADFRSPVTDGPGLADLVRNPDMPLNLDTDADGLTRVAAGAGAHPDLLTSEGMKGALQSLLSRYDYLVVSCPPLPEYGDAVAIAPHVDASILVISAGVTGRDEAVRARDALERVGARILGIVMVERPRRWF